MAEVVGTRNGDGWFKTSEIQDFLEALHVPKLSNASATLGNLRTSSLVTSRTNSKPWSLTPVGREEARALMGSFSFEQISAELAETPGALFADVKHSVVSPLFAPHEWQRGIEQLMERYPFETNVFCMTRFPKLKDHEFPDPIAAVISKLRSVVHQHGMTLHLASDRQAEDTIFGNVGAHMWACQYGIGLLETRAATSDSLNDNVLMELASMIFTGRRCAILKDSGTPSPPTDLVGHIYKSVDFENIEEVGRLTHLWLAEDLGLGRCDVCPAPIINVSA